MPVVLFGHSFVKRFAGRCKAVVDIELERESIPITCLGEGGLSLSRMASNHRRYYQLIAKANPSILIIDLGTNDLCSRDIEPEALLDSLCAFVRDMKKYAIYPSVIVFLPVLPRTGNMRPNQVSVDQFNSKAEAFNKLLEGETLREDKWWLWTHRGLKHPRYNVDGVHLTTQGMTQYGKTIRQLVKFFQSRIW